MTTKITEATRGANSAEVEKMMNKIAVMLTMREKTVYNGKSIVVLVNDYRPWRRGNKFAATK